MENSYQNSVIAQILEAIIDSGTYDGATNSEIADILLSILNEEPYTKAPNSVIAELFLKVKAKIEGESYEPFDKPYISRIAEILISILNESEYNDAPNSRVAELLLELKEAIESLNEATVKGAVCSFTTNVAKPLVSLKAGFKATQEAGTPTPSEPKAIDGVSSVKVTRCGFNLFNEEAWFTANGYTKNSDGSWYRSTNPLAVTLWENSSKYSGQISIHFKYKYDNATASVGFRIKIVYTDGTSTTIYTSQTDTFLDKDVSSSGSKVVDKIVTDYGSASNGSTLKDFCINIKGSYEYEQYNGNTITISLGETYYGGYIQKDNSGSKLVLTHKTIDWNDVSFSYNATYGMLFTISDLKTGISNISNLLKCSHYENAGTAGFGYITDGKIGTNSSSGLNTDRVCIKDSNYTDANTFKTFLTTSNAQLVYELATPIELPLTDIPDITTLTGVNNVFNDSANTEVTYLYKGEPPINALSLGAGFGLGSSLSPSADVEPAVEPDISDDSEEV